MKGLEAKLRACTRRGEPGGGILVIREGKTVFKRGFGFANIPRSEKVTPASNFRLASVSKHFTAFAVAMLEERGLIDVTRPAGYYIPGFPRYGRNIRVRHLIHHMGGLPGYEHLTSTNRKAGKISKPRILKELRKAKKLVFSPGARYEYSNSGYVMLALLVEQVTGMRFSQFMREQVFLPAGMEKTVVMDLPAPRIERRVTGYGYWPMFTEFDYSNLNFYAGDGGFYSSLDDFERWAAALENHVLVGPETMDRIYSPVKANNGKTINYGYGWDLGKHMKFTHYSHGGAWVGFRTLISRIPQKRLWFVVLANSCSVNVWNLWGEAINHCAPELAWPKNRRARMPSS